MTVRGSPRSTHPLAVLGALAVLPLGCQGGPRFVSIDAEHGYVDGCTDITLQGAELGTDVAVTVAGTPVLDLAPAEIDPSKPDHAQDVGFLFTARTPPKADGEKGFVDVVMTVGTQRMTLADGFYYEACPGTVHVDEVGTEGPVPTGTSVTLAGCGLDQDTVVGALLADDGTEVASFPIAATCSTARATFVLPSVPDGTYWIALNAGDGSTWGGACTGTPSDTDTDGDTDTEEDTDTDGDTDTDAAADTAATSDTADPCAGLVQITVGAPVEGGE